MQVVLGCVAFGFACGSWCTRDRLQRTLARLTAAVLLLLLPTTSSRCAFLLLQFGLPDLAGRVHILKIHAKSMAVDKDIRYELLARLCPSSTGAELRSVCTEAGMFAIRSRRKSISEKDFLESINKVIRSYKKFSATPKYMVREEGERGRRSSGWSVGLQRSSSRDSRRLVSSTSRCAPILAVFLPVARRFTTEAPDGALLALSSAHWLAAWLSHWHDCRICSAIARMR